MIDIKIWLRFLVKICLSLVLGGLFYSLWLILFLLTNSSENQITESILWLISPLITALGFTTGIMLYDHWTGATRTLFWKIYLWAFIGCVLGAVAVYWFGPMLIVFSMLFIGTVSMTTREILKMQRSDLT